MHADATEDALPGACFPASHLMHDGCPFPAWYVPARQFVQSSALVAPHLGPYLPVLH